MRAGPSVFTIPAGENFVAALARQLLAETAGDPLALSAMLILLPTRRSVRALRDAFLWLSEGRPLLLPRMRPLGDLDDDDPDLAQMLSTDLPPAIAPLRRRLILARQIMALGGERGGAHSAEQAVPLAQELERLLDQAQTEELSFDRLAELVPDDYAAHWQVTLQFLNLVTEHWPRILQSEGALDPIERRARLLHAQAAAWEVRSPEHPVIAAGSTGSVPATRRLLTVVANLPHGRLVLPGLDRLMDADGVAACDESHPQTGLHRLLDAVGLEPHRVPLWPGTTEHPRARLIAETMRPAASTDAWRRLDAAAIRPGLAGITRIDCPGAQEEAGVIALHLRAALEEPGKTAALVTPDRTLARRVAAELRRFGIEIDDSAGTPLALTEPGTFLLLTAIMVAEGFAPHDTLAALKHPLASGGTAAARFRHMVRRLELTVLRGARPEPGIAGMRKVNGAADLDRWLARLETMTAPFAAALATTMPLGDLLKAHITCAEALAADDGVTGAEKLWAGDAGAAASGFVLDLAEAAAGAALPEIPGAGYPALLRELMAGQVVRPAWGRHPRLSIWGPLEARLQQADLIVLGGLNEGTWPAEAPPDPWMSRPMRARFGLAAPERRIGLAAHDFAQGACSPEVVLTRAERQGGAPTVPSRWLMRLDAMLAASGLDPLPRDNRWLAWQSALGRPATERSELPRPPAPRPPLAARPRRLSVTAIETWRRDPYALYARSILGLRALDPIDADPEAADYGEVVHRALDTLLRTLPEGAMPGDAFARLMEIGRESFGPALARPGVVAFWLPRFERIARWFIDHETGRRHRIAAVATEVKGSLAVETPGGQFIVEAKADRIDRRTDGKLEVIDYKTGSLPKPGEVEAGFAPQLPLEGLIAAAGGFATVPAGEVAALLYWRLSGAGARAGEARDATPKASPGALIEAARDGLVRLVAAFDDPATPYEARPNPVHVPRYSDYLHLARVKEWVSGTEDELEWTNAR